MATDLAVAGDGSIYITGKFKGTIDLGDPVTVSDAERGVYLAKLDPADGSVVWSIVAVDETPITGSDASVTTDGDGNVIWAFSYEDVTSIAGQDLATGAASIAVAKIAPDKSVVWARSHGGDEGEAESGVPGCTLDDGAAGAELPCALRFVHHVDGDAILDAASGVERFVFHHHGALAPGREAPQTDQGCLSHCLQDIFVNPHFCWTPLNGGR